MATIRQFSRFALVGVLCTTIYAVLYLILADAVLPKGYATMAVPPAFLAALVCGYVLNARWSFGDVAGPMSGAQAARFAAAQSVGLACNLAATYAMTGPLGLPTWTPLIPAVLLVPALTFALLRHWVFAARSATQSRL